VTGGATGEMTGTAKEIIIAVATLMTLVRETTTIETEGREGLLHQRTDTDSPGGMMIIRGHKELGILLPPWSGQRKLLFPRVPYPVSLDLGGKQFAESMSALAVGSSSVTPIQPLLGTDFLQLPATRGTLKMQSP